MARTITDKNHVRRIVEVERDMICEALSMYNGHITEAAARLGIGRSTLYRKMQEYGITEKRATWTKRLMSDHDAETRADNAGTTSTYDM